MTRIAKQLLCAVLGCAAAGLAIYGLWKQPFLEMPLVGVCTLDGFSFDDLDPGSDRSAITRISQVLAAAAGALFLPRWPRLLSPVLAGVAGWLAYKALQPLHETLQGMTAFAQQSGSADARNMLDQVWKDTHFLSGSHYFLAGTAALILIGLLSFFITKRPVDRRTSGKIEPALPSS